MSKRAFLDIGRKTTTQAILAFCATLAILFWQSHDRWQQAPYADEVTYMSLALPLYDTGVYQDGNFKNTNGRKGANGEGMFFAPLYPAFLTALIHLSPSFEKTVRCSVEHRRPVDITAKCSPLNLEIMIVAQIILMALGALCAWITAIIVTGHKGIAWISLFFILSGKDYGELASVAMSESLVLPLFSFSMLAALLAWRQKSLKWALLCGISAGFLCLAKPSFVYLILCLLPFALLFCAIRFVKKRDAKPLHAILLFACLFTAITAPWVIRNGTKVGVWDISYGLAPFTFAQRVAFNDMSWTEWMTSFVYGIPSFGDNLAEDLFPKETYIRHDFGNPEGFYQQGNHVLRPQTLKESGSYAVQFSYLVENHMLNQPFKHVMVTFSLVWRGMWVGGKLALIAIPALLAFLIIALKKKNWDFILYALPPVFMLGFHAFTSVNVARYNLIMLPLLGLVFGWIVLWGWRKCISKNPSPLPGFESLPKDRT